MLKWTLILIICIALLLTGCQPIQNTARDSIAAFQGLLIAAQERHAAECIASSGNNQVCKVIVTADYAENAAVTALEAYCGMGPGVDPKTKCVPVKSGEAALKAALANLKSLTTDIKEATK